MISAVSHHNFDTRLFSSGGGPQEVTLQDVGKEEMEEILEDYEEGGREESGYVVLDVREVNEIEYTGKLSPNTITFPLQKVMQYNAFALDDDEFEEIFGFEKPGMDETLVFSCAMGVRSVHAANFAAQGGYTKLVNYRGGANQWFL
jgi:rhodanese-related sulfurtransferase